MKTEGTRVIRNVKNGKTRVKRKHGMTCKKWIKLKKNSGTKKVNSVETLKKGGFTRSKKGTVGMESMARVE